jgi:subfamily B ATP-binding cassette protein MsbA
MAVTGRLYRDYLSDYRGKLGLAIAMMLVISATTAALAWLLKPAIDILFVSKDKSVLFTLPAVIIAITVIKAAATYGQGIIMSKVGQDIVARLQLGLFRSMVFADLQRLISTHSGSFLAQAVNNVNLVQLATNQTIVAFARDLTSVLFLGGVMYLRDWRLALIATAIIPFVLLNTRKQGKKTRKATIRSMSETGTLTTLISENLDGTRVVKAYGQEEREIERTNKSILRRRDFQMKALKARVAAAPVTEAIQGLGIAGAIFYGGYQGVAGTLTLGDFMSFLIAMLLTYDPLKRLSNLSTVLTQGLTAAENVFEELDMPQEIYDDTAASNLELSGGRIEFDNVSFHYNGDKAALTGVSFVANPGETIALVGPSGAGKSTVLNLIPRFFDASSGSVTIDGHDVKTVTLKSLRNAIALVTQEPFLFDDTIHANIAYGRPDASREEVINAANAAAAHTFIEELPEGYDTLAGEGGARLSGGQRQRIAIARAMLKDAPILLLDEATSSLDTRSESHVQDALKTLMKNPTTIVIAHRLSTIIDADKIFVMDQGRVVEAGKHEELLKRGQLYASLYTTEFSSEEEVETEFAGTGV